MKIEHFILFAICFLFFLFYFQKKYSFCIDIPSQNERHKLLLKPQGKIPLSGGFYFFIIISILFFEYYLFETLFALFLFILGLMSDLKLAVSPKLRLFFQFLIIAIFTVINQEIVILTNISQIDNLMENNFLRMLIVTFFFLVLINGYNFLDGVNLLCSANLVIVLFFLYLLLDYNNDLILSYKIQLFIISFFIFIIANFFGKIFLGDGGIYGLSFFIGILLVNLSLNNNSVSPYFIANLFWYAAFENLFSIIRRIVHKKKNYLPDNLHLHQILFKFLDKKNFFKKKYLLSSFIGIVINIYLLIINTLGYLFYSDSKIQILLILFSSLTYISLYIKFKNV